MLLRRWKLDYSNQKSKKCLYCIKSKKFQWTVNFFFRSVSILQSLKGILLRMRKNEFGQARNFEIYWAPGKLWKTFFYVFYGLCYFSWCNWDKSILKVNKLCIIPTMQPTKSREGNTAWKVSVFRVFLARIFPHR